jgi:hypothetical protein
MSDRSMVYFNLLARLVWEGDIGIWKPVVGDVGLIVAKTPLLTNATATR